MKTSLKLLIGLVLCLIIAMFGAAISLRNQYDKLDKSDRYASWQKKSLPAFRAVKITGPSAAIVLIEPGASPRLLCDSLAQPKNTTYTSRVESDTLFLQVAPIAGWNFRIEDEDDEWHSPQIVVQVPTLTAVSTVNALCQIHNFKGENLTLKQNGKGGKILLEHLKMNQLTASLSGQNQLVLYGINNRIDRANITARNSARVFQYTDFQEGLTLTADSTVKLRLTGKALQQIQR